MNRAAWIGLLATAAAMGQAQAEAPTSADTTKPANPFVSLPRRGSIAVGKIGSVVEDGAVWAKGDTACKDREALKWGAGKGAIDVARLMGPVRSELRHGGVIVADDPTDPFGAHAPNELTVSAMVTGVSAKVCGTEDLSGQVEMTVLWEVSSKTAKLVIDSIRTTYTAHADKPAPMARLLDEAMTGNVAKLLQVESFQKALKDGARGSLVASERAEVEAARRAEEAAISSEYGPIVAHGDTRPHHQDKLAISDTGPRGMPITESVKSVVSIYRPGSLGSGFLISNDGWILTAAHVVGSSDIVQLRWSDGKTTTGEVVRRDNRRDVALVRTKDHGHHALPLRPGSAPIGEAVYAIGAPSALFNTVTRGIVSAERELGGFKFVQSDAAVNPGNSGGPLLNERGEVVGIADLSNRSAPGINFFVPVSDALLFLGVQAH